MRDEVDQIVSTCLDNLEVRREANQRQLESFSTQKIQVLLAGLRQIEQEHDAGNDLNPFETVRQQVVDSGLIGSFNAQLSTVEKTSQLRKQQNKALEHEADSVDKFNIESASESNNDIVLQEQEQSRYEEDEQDDDDAVDDDFQEENSE